MNPNEFISVATLLVAGDGEGRLRSAVSRAYYGAFHVAKRFLLECGVIIPFDFAAHRNVRWCLANSAESAIVQAGRRLESLRDARNDADYDLANSQFSIKANAMAQLQRSVEIITLLAAYESDDARLRVASRIKAYATTLGLPVQP